MDGLLIVLLMLGLLTAPAPKRHAKPRRRSR